MPYTDSTDPVVLARTAADLQQLQDAGIENTAAGAAVYQAIAGDPGLTGRQKQAVCCELGKAIVAHGIAVAGDHPETLLRQSDASTRFMSSYMEDSASRFFDAVKETAEEVGRQHVQAAPANAGAAVDYGDPAVPGAARALLNAFDSEKHKLSADACEFMQACTSGIPAEVAGAQRVEVENTLAVNTLMLRGVMPMIANEAGALRNNTNASDSSRNRAAMTSEANRSAMKFLAGQVDGFASPITNCPAGTVLAQDMPLRQQMQQVTRLMAAGDHAQLQVGAHVSVKDSLRQAFGKDNPSKLAQAQAKLTARQQKLAALETQLQTSQTSTQIKADTLVANASNPHAAGQIQQDIHTVREMQEAAKKLGGKIQNQQQKVERSEARVDDLKTRIGRR